MCDVCPRPPSTLLLTLSQLHFIAIFKSLWVTEFSQLDTVLCPPLQRPAYSFWVVVTKTRVPLTPRCTTRLKESSSSFLPSITPFLGHLEFQQALYVEDLFLEPAYPKPTLYIIYSMVAMFL